MAVISVVLLTLFYLKDQDHNFLWKTTTQRIISSFRKWNSECRADLQFNFNSSLLVVCPSLQMEIFQNCVLVTFHNSDLQWKCPNFQATDRYLKYGIDWQTAPAQSNRSLTMLNSSSYENSYHLKLFFFRPFKIQGLIEPPTTISMRTIPLTRICLASCQAKWTFSYMVNVNSSI